MTNITISRAIVEQALEAMRCAVPTGKITVRDWWRAIDALETTLAQQAEPVEPVAWCSSVEFSDALKYAQSFNGWRRKYPKTDMPLYTAPPQRKPLTADKTMALANETAGANWGDEAHLQRFRAAVERAHGITDPQVADHLARHGIPMPGDPK